MLPPNLDAAHFPPLPTDVRTNTDSSTDRTPSKDSSAVRVLAELTVVSALFFASTIGLSAAKLIWFDEIISYRISGLPRVADVWTALAKDGPDVTPPLNFLLIRASFSLLGEGQIAARMPSIVGVWVMCLCVFAFMARRYRAEYCWAAVFLLLGCDVITYSIEARPYGAMLGFTGLALVAWQAATEGRAPVFSRMVLWTSMACAISSHYYAILVLIPFGLGEIARTALRRRVDWGLWAALFGSLAPLGFYLPIIRRSGVGSKSWSQSSSGPLWGMVFDAYRSFLDNATISFVALLVLGAIVLVFTRRPRLGPVRTSRARWAIVAGASAILSLTVGLFAVAAFLIMAMAARLFSRSEGPAVGRPGSLPPHDVVMLIGLVALPFFGMILARQATNAFEPRYVFPAIIGLSILTPAVVSAASGHRAWAGRILALACLFGLLTSQFVPGLRDAYRVVRGKSSSALTGQVYVDSFRRMYPVADRSDFVIAHIDDYLRLHFYADDDLRNRIFCVLGDDSVNQPDLPIKTGISNVPYNIMTVKDFLKDHRDFYLLNAITPPGNGRSELVFNKLIERGVRINLDQVQGRRNLYRCETRDINSP